ncbi:MAG TPA: alginate lyase family protein [Pyrinomonadaceae bacterium]|jgi:hypothetical protein|nr:alginate lyase family protein [Pyrinomonadaceae bacterium]
MANPLDKFKKIRTRSWSELRARGSQVISAYTEKIGLSGGLPSENEIWNLIDPEFFAGEEAGLKTLLANFRKTSAATFFPSLVDKEISANSFRRLFGEQVIDCCLERAEKIMEGKFDLLGHKNLYLGQIPDWHYEPISGKRSPMKHWRQFEDYSNDETGDKKVVWELNRHQHFFALGVAYHLTSHEKYAERFIKHLFDWMEQNPPQQGVNWSSSLEVAFRAMSWIWGLNFFKNSKFFDSKALLQVLRYLYSHGSHLEKYLSTYYSPNTHLTGEALGLYYLGTQTPFYRAKKWRALGEKILLEELDRQILADGVYFEQSTWYQRYTADFYLHFLILNDLKPETDAVELNEAVTSRVQKMLDYLMYITRPDGTTPIIGDDDGGRMLPLSSRKPNDFRAVLSTAAVLLNRDDYKFVAGAPAEEMFWLLGDPGVKEFKGISPLSPEDESRAFTDGGYFMMRDGWDKSDNYMLIDCGQHGALSSAHSHADVLSFELAAGGKTLLVDPGTYTYHKSGELRDYFRSSLAHNTLVIDERSSSIPGSTFKWEKAAKPEVKKWIAQDRFDFFEGSHDGYDDLPESAAKHTRSILFLKNDYWIIRDYVETFGEHTYQLNFHFDPNTDPRAENPEEKLWSIVENSDKNAGLKLLLFGDNGEWQKRESWVSTCYGGRVNAPYLRFISKGKGPQEFFTFFLPSLAADGEATIEEIDVNGGRAFAINNKGYQDLFFFGDGGGQIARNPLFSTDFRFAWTRVAEGETQPEEYVFIDGKYLVLNDRQIIDHPSNLEFATARRLGQKLNVRTSEGLFSVSLPSQKPQRPKAYVLKDSLQSDDE